MKPFENVSYKEIVWANKYDPWAEQARQLGVYHWSRVFEYPWSLFWGSFDKGQWVLDAAGGDGLLQTLITNQGAQVINIDQDSSKKPKDENKILFSQGDLRKLNIQDETFDRVVCVSVLEHIDSPMQVLKELWRVLKPRGRLLVTMDIASYSRWNHTIDIVGADQIVGLLGLVVPEIPESVLTQRFNEIERKPSDPLFVDLKVLCFYADKRAA